MDIFQKPNGVGDYIGRCIVAWHNRLEGAMNVGKKRGTGQISAILPDQTLIEIQLMHLARDWVFLDLYQVTGRCSILSGFLSESLLKNAFRDWWQKSAWYVYHMFIPGALCIIATIRYYMIYYILYMNGAIGLISDLILIQTCWELLLHQNCSTARWTMFQLSVNWSFGIWPCIWFLKVLMQIWIG